MWAWLKKKLARVMASGTANPAQWLIDWVRGTPVDSGIPYDNKTPLRSAPVWYAIRKISGHVGQLPLILYQRSEDGKQKAVKHPAYRLMKVRPNKATGASLWKETLMHHALRWGNGRARIVRDGRANPLSLWLLHPCETVTLNLLENNIVVEKIHMWTNPTTREQLIFPDDDVLHICGLSLDGINGENLNELAKNSWSLGLAAEKSQNRFYANNAVPSLILEAPPGIFRSEADAQEFLRKFNEYHQGADKANRVGLLREGIKATPLAVSGRDAQTIDQRRFQRQEVALWFLLESILGDDSSVSYNSLEQKNMAYLINCLMGWLVKIEEECNEKLLSVPEKAVDSHFFKFQTAALLRGSTVERFQVYQIARQIGVFSANDCRDLEDMNPIAGGDSYDNPAITVAQPQQDDRDDDQGVSSDDRARMAIASRLRELIRVEVRRVRDGGSRSKNFCDWLDRFYRAFESRIATVFEGCGGDYDDAGEYVAESRALLLDIAGVATADELPGMIFDGTADWTDRAEAWTDRLMKGTRNVKDVVPV